MFPWSGGAKVDAVASASRLRPRERQETARPPGCSAFGRGRRYRCTPRTFGYDLASVPTPQSEIATIKCMLICCRSNNFPVTVFPKLQGTLSDADGGCTLEGSLGVDAHFRLRMGVMSAFVFVLMPLLSCFGTSTELVPGGAWIAVIVFSGMLFAVYRIGQPDIARIHAALERAFPSVRS